MAVDRQGSGRPLGKFGRRLVGGKFIVRERQSRALTALTRPAPPAMNQFAIRSRSEGVGVPLENLGESLLGENFFFRERKSRALTALPRPAPPAMNQFAIRY